MGRVAFRLPDIGEGIAEAEIVAWHVKIGDLVEEDQPLADLMTDKATVEMSAPVSGKVLELAGAVGDNIAIGSTLALFETEEEGAAAPPPAPESTPAAPVTASPLADGPEAPAATPACRYRRRAGRSRAGAGPTRRRTGAPSGVRRSQGAGVARGPSARQVARRRSSRRRPGERTRAPCRSRRLSALPG